MKQRVIGVISLVGILILGLIFSFIFVNSSFDQTSHLENQDCIEVNKVASFIYETCYDAYTQSIFMDVQRGADTYRVTEMQLEFFDSAQRDYVIKDVPEAGSGESYQIFSPRNPTNIDITLGIVKDFSSAICESPRRIFVDYCPSRTDNESIGAQLNPLNGNSNNQNVVIGNIPRETTDTLSENLVAKEAAWKLQCESNWKCSDWETPFDSDGDGIEEQARHCWDQNNCAIPTGAPPTRRLAGDACEENWGNCIWEACTNGYTRPTSCTDFNQCGTTHDLPQRLPCGEGTILTECSSNIQYGPWSTCGVNYNFLDLSGSSVLDLQGQRTRQYYDTNGCIPNGIETQACSTSVDVYTREFIRCGLAYRGIYNTLTDELIAQIRLGSQDDPSLDISLTGEENGICAHCTDGILNGDEEGPFPDCGGSCQSCTEKYGANYYSNTGGFAIQQNIIASLLNLEEQSIFAKKFLAMAL